MLQSSSSFSWLANPTWLSYAYLAGCLSCVALLSAALYFEYVLYMDPCPMCMVQRLATFLIGVGFLVAFLGRNHRWLLIVSLLFVLAAAILGVWSADHHIWLQHLPKEEVPACGPGIDYLIDTLPLSELLDVMLKGDGNCAETVWSFLGLSMPEWTRVYFALYLLAALYALAMTWKQQHKTEQA